LKVHFEIDILINCLIDWILKQVTTCSGCSRLPHVTGEYYAASQSENSRLKWI